jgi:hypothetical protein
MANPACFGGDSNSFGLPSGIDRKYSCNSAAQSSTRPARTSYPAPEQHLQRTTSRVFLCIVKLMECQKCELHNSQFALMVERERPLISKALSDPDARDSLSELLNVRRTTDELLEEWLEHVETKHRPDQQHEV